MEAEMKRLSFVLLIAVSLILSGCAPAATPAPIAPRAGEQPFMAVGAPMEAPAAKAAPAPRSAPADEANGSTTGSDVTNTNTQRLVVQTAELTIVVQDVKTRVTQIEQMAETMGGNLVSENIGQTYAPDGTQQPAAQIVIRV